MTMAKLTVEGQTVAQMAEMLWYEQEGCGIESQSGYRNFTIYPILPANWSWSLLSP
jgi:hypothetical protein